MLFRSLGVLLAVGGAWLVLVVPDKDGSSVSPVWVLVPVLAGAVVVGASIVFTSVAVVLDAAGVHLRFGPWGRPRRDIPWSSVTSVEVVDVRVLPWGGWGYRWNPWKKGTAAVMRRGPGLQFDLSDARMLVEIGRAHV